MMACNLRTVSQAKMILTPHEGPTAVMAARVVEEVGAARAVDAAARVGAGVARAEARVETEIAVATAA